MAKVWAIVPAAGAGRRMLSATPKQYLPLAGANVLQVTLEKLNAVPGLAGVVVALGLDDTWFARTIEPPPNVETMVGGLERADSVFNGLKWLMARGCGDDWALVHDAARPCVQVERVQQLIDLCLHSGRGGLLAAPVVDTLKRVGSDQTVQATVDRSQLWLAHTPQMFPVKLLYRALEQAFLHGTVVTDECSAIESVGERPQVVLDSWDNIKITWPEDLALAEIILSQQRLLDPEE